MKQYPTVLVFCPCNESLNLKFGDKEQIGGSSGRLHPEDSGAPPLTLLTDKSTRHRLEWLYYCESCRAVRCHKCVEEEVVSIYCPTCLNESTESEAKRDHNKCTRNCFTCPCCLSRLLITSTLNSNGTDKIYTLICPGCEWKWDGATQFDKTKSLTRQIRSKMVKETPEYQLYQKLRGYYTEKFRADTNSLKHQKSPFSSMEFSSSSRRSSTERPLFIPIQLDEEYDMRISKLTSKVETSSQLLEMKEHLVSEHDPKFPDSLVPIAQDLRSKTSKLCKACRRILIKPDPRPHSAKFLTKDMAINYLPTLEISHMPENKEKKFVPGILNKMLLTIINPLLESVTITISTQAQTTGRYSHKVTILCPTVKLGPNFEKVDEKSLVKATPSHLYTRKSKYIQTELLERGANVAMSNIHLNISISSNIGDDDKHDKTEEGRVYEEGRNWACIPFEVVPSVVDKTQEDGFLVEIPFFVSISTNRKEENLSVGFWTVGQLGMVYPLKF